MKKSLPPRPPAKNFIQGIGVGDFCGLLVEFACGLGGVDFLRVRGF